MNVLSQWPALAAAGLIGLRERSVAPRVYKVKQGRPRLYSDEERRQRARAAEKRYRERRKAMFGGQQ